jgi:hypothetical protein
MKNFLQTKLTVENRRDFLQNQTLAQCQISISPVLLSRTRFRKSNGL